MFSPVSQGGGLLLSVANSHYFTYLQNLDFLGKLGAGTYLCVDPKTKLMGVDKGWLWSTNTVEQLEEVLVDTFDCTKNEGAQTKTLWKAAYAKLLLLEQFYRSKKYPEHAAMLERVHKRFSPDNRIPLDKVRALGATISYSPTFQARETRLAEKEKRGDLKDQMRQLLSLMEESDLDQELIEAKSLLERILNPPKEEKPQPNKFQDDLRRALAGLRRVEEETGASKKKGSDLVGGKMICAVSQGLLDQLKLRSSSKTYDQMSNHEKEIYEARNPHLFPPKEASAPKAPEIQIEQGNKVPVIQTEKDKGELHYLSSRETLLVLMRVMDDHWDDLESTQDEDELASDWSDYTESYGSDGEEGEDPFKEPPPPAYATAQKVATYVPVGLSDDARAAITERRGDLTSSPEESEDSEGN